MLFFLPAKAVPASRAVVVSALVKAARGVRGTSRAIAASLRGKGSGIFPAHLLLWRDAFHGASRGSPQSALSGPDGAPAEARATAASAAATVPADREAGAANARNFFAPSPFPRVRGGASCHSASEGQPCLPVVETSSADSARATLVFPPGSISASVSALLVQSWQEYRPVGSADSAPQSVTRARQTAQEVQGVS